MSSPAGEEDKKPSADQSGGVHINLKVKGQDQEEHSTEEAYERSIVNAPLEMEDGDEIDAMLHQRSIICYNEDIHG
ncbi:hypothetical protein Leryth_001698 [Lithospermum erythrorhizon]|nr:hypothetical protein Leryth_001698 [Lithospermum erythrorhizon]